MTLFQTKIQFNHQQIAQILKNFWNINLGKLLQTSQNSTFEGFRTTQQGLEQKFAIRVSPDPQNACHQKIEDEVFFVNYLSSHNLKHICSFVPKTVKQTSNTFVHYENNFSIVVISWVNGQKLPFSEFEWMKNKKIVFTWGKFFAQMHQISKTFQKQHPQIAQRIQSWRQIHNGILSDVKLDQKDENDVSNPQHYGVLHGDLNISNFCFDKANGSFNAYDTDQVQRGFFLWDLSRAIFTSYMLEKAGMPNSGDLVPDANYKEFTQWIVEGYESVTGKGSVDRERLQRMVALNHYFYVTFCTKALQEGTIPQDIRGFIEYIVKNLKKQE